MSKILLIPDFSPYGGTYTYFKDLINFYYLQKYEVVLLLRKSQLNEEIIKLIKKYDFKYLLFPIKHKFFIKLRSKFLFESLYNFFILIPFYFKIKPDLVVVSTGTPGNLLSLIFLPSKFIYVLHTYPIKSKHIFLIKLFLISNLGKRKRILTVSEFAKKEIIKVWGLSRKNKYINVIYNTIINDKKVTLLSKIKEKNNDEKVKILTIGHLRW